jgi:hypothetical protein
VKEGGRENKMMPKKFSESNRSRSSKMNHGINVTDNAAQTKGAERRTSNGTTKLAEEKQMTPMSNEGMLVDLKTG